MKLLALAFNLTVTVAFLILAAPKLGFFAALLLVFILGALLAERMPDRCMIATLILPRILQKAMAAYYTKLPMIKYLAMDVSDTSIKFGQEIIAQMPVIPTATSHVPGADLTVGAQNVKDLIGDIPMKIDRAAKVVLKLPTVDAVALELSEVFNMAVANAGLALAEYIVGDAIGTVAAGTFSHQIVELAADFDRDTLSKARVQMNLQKAGAPRFGIVSLDAMSTLTADPRIASGDYHGKLIDDNPYVTLENLEGFKAITEFASFPGDGAVGAFTAAVTDVITLAGHHLVNGARIRVSNSGGALPAGLAAGTDYFVRDADSDTFKVSATLGGAVVDITGTGTGTHTLNRYEHLSGFFFDARAMLIAIRDLNDNVEFAKQLGIPVPILVEKHTDAQTGLTFTGYMWIDQKTHDIYVAIVVAFGVRAGRQVSTNGADSLLDRSGVRVVTAA